MCPTCGIFYFISTHTLTWSVTCGHILPPPLKGFQLTRSRGAWRLRFSLFLILQDFNSHAHVERDDWNSLIIYLLLHFNSHAHVERDQILMGFTLILLDFNSHAHVERDAVVVLSIGQIFISTHTLTWSVTISSNRNCTCCQFQLTRSRGAWRLPWSGLRSRRYFNSHAHVERDHLC